jgi:hypothetical protein
MAYPPRQQLRANVMLVSASSLSGMCNRQQFQSQRLDLKCRIAPGVSPRLPCDQHGLISILLAPVAEVSAWLHCLQKW